MIAEPGRYVVTSAFTLATQVISKRRTQSAAAADQEPSSCMYYINDGVYGSFNCLLYDHAEVTPQILNLVSAKEVPPDSVFSKRVGTLSSSRV